MSADGQMPDAPAPAPDAPAATEAPVVNDALMARLDEMQQQLGRLSAPQETDQWQGAISDLPYAEGDPSQQFDQSGFQPDPGFQGFGQEQYQPGQYGLDQYQDPQQAQQQAMQQLQGFIQEQVQQGVQQHVTPWMQQQQANELERQYPDLANPETAGKVVAEAAQYVQRLGLPPEQARNPKFVELVFLAQQARTNASQETPADGGSDVHLESGGAAPQQEELDGADRMLKAWGKL